LLSFDSFDIFDSLLYDIRIDVRGNELIRILPRYSNENYCEFISDKVRFSYDALKIGRLNYPFYQGNIYIEHCFDEMELFSTEEYLMLSVDVLYYLTCVKIKRLKMSFNKILQMVSEWFVSVIKLLTVNKIRYIMFNLSFGPFSDYKLIYSLTQTLNGLGMAYISKLYGYYHNKLCDNSNLYKAKKLFSYKL